MNQISHFEQLRDLLQLDDIDEDVNIMFTVRKGVMITVSDPETLPVRQRVVKCVQILIDEDKSFNTIIFHCDDEFDGVPRRLEGVDLSFVSVYRLHAAI